MLVARGPAAPLLSSVALPDDIIGSPAGSPGVVQGPIAVVYSQVSWVHWCFFSLHHRKCWRTRCGRSLTGTPCTTTSTCSRTKWYWTWGVVLGSFPCSLPRQGPRRCLGWARHFLPHTGFHRASPSPSASTRPPRSTKFGPSLLLGSHFWGVEEIRCDAQEGGQAACALHMAPGSLWPLTFAEELWLSWGHSNVIMTFQCLAPRSASEAVQVVTWGSSGLSLCISIH